MGAESLKPVVITIVRGRHDHLAVQRAHLRAQHPTLTHVVVAMGDPDIPRLLADDPATDVVTLAVHGDAMPLAAARNAGVARAREHGADVLILLDVDCLPDRGLVEAYAAAAAAYPDALLCGPVTYLPEGQRIPDPGADLDPLWRPHPARPDPGRGQLQAGGDHRLFWSLSFAVTPATWDRFGGFCEAYVGYGGEDTDTAFAAREAGVDLVWVGGARAFHQHHPVQDPPLQHLVDIVTNARVFHRRWGVWPMEGWLRAFADRGLIEWKPESVELRKN